jgi:aldehyde:ferredoxin oxidoreductase
MGCFACPAPCSTFFEIKNGPFAGLKSEGPKAETLCDFGYRCSIDDLAMVLYANTLCNRLGLDVISTAGVIAFITECYEKGLITQEKTDGIDVRFGNSDAVIQLIKKIAFREGILLYHLQRSSSLILLTLTYLSLDSSLCGKLLSLILRMLNPMIYIL